MIVFSSLGSAAEAVHYNYFLELTSLIFLVAITICYWSRRKFPTTVFKLFGFGLFAVTLNVFLGVLSYFFLNKANTVDIRWVELLLSIYYFLQVVCSYLLFAYIFFSLGNTVVSCAAAFTVTINKKI